MTDEHDDAMKLIRVIGALDFEDIWEWAMEVHILVDAFLKSHEEPA